jgi:hypothetical protein
MHHMNLYMAHGDEAHNAVEKVTHGDNGVKNILLALAVVVAIGCIIYILNRKSKTKS